MSPGDERWARLTGVVDVDALRERHVLVVGVGSGGSTVALELAKAGVGGLTLVDPDRLEAANVIRHECDDRFLGRTKVEAVADLIRHRNPEARVEAIPKDVFALADLPELVAGADLVAACADVEPPKRLLNRTALAAGIPVVYAGVYARGVGGEVIVCAGGPEDPCYACVVSALKEPASPAVEEDLDYGAVGPDGTIHGAPGLGLDVRLVALLHAKIGLGLLLGAEAPATVVLFGTAAVPGLFPRPFASALVSVAPRRDCLVCGPMRADLMSAEPPR